MTDDSSFQAALALVLKMEGGRVDDPQDPGGRTDYGITQSTYDAWLRAHGAPVQDVYNISLTEVGDIYFNRYASPIMYSLLPKGVGYAVFDEAVNSGVIAAVKTLQRQTHATVDGVMGMLTATAAHNRLPKILIDDLCTERLTFLHRLKGWGRFGKGWTNRIEFVRSHAKAMVA